MAKHRRRKKGSRSLGALKADIMRCAQYAKSKSGLTRCGRFLPGPGKPTSVKRKKKYHYTTAKGRAARAKAKRKGRR